MRLKVTIVIGLAALLGATAIATTKLKTRYNQNAKQNIGLQVPIVAKQLPTENGVIPVELQCGTARLTAPNTLESFSCIVKNNTSKNITAASTAYTIVVENNGKESGDTGFLTLETFIHPDLADIHKAIPPRGERTIEPGGPVSYEYGNPIIKRVELKIDYVEFEDKTSLGPNEMGSQIIALFRDGAAKYRDWLVQKYIENGRSIDAIAPLLQKSQPIPDVLELKSSRQRHGAMMYRNHMLDIYNAHGATGLAEHLNGSH